VLPAAWLLVESVRSASGLGGPWGLLGASQWRLPAFLAAASLGGAWLVSFLVVAVNVGVVALLTARPWTARAGAAVLALLGLAVGPVWSVLQPAPTGGGALRVAVVQAGVVHAAGARLDQEVAATEALPPGRYDLIVWGESSVGFDLDRRPDVLQRLQQLSARAGADLLVNVDAAAASGKIRKMSVLVGPDGVQGSYAKMRLVPFGEYIPLRPVLGWLASVTKAAALDRVRGDGIRVLRLPVGSGELAFSPLICFESAFPDMTRAAVRAGADLVVYQSATTTFQGTWAPDQHASLAAVRAVESGRPVVHATLSGTSAAFDPTGRAFAWHPAATGVTTFDLPRASRRTPYAQMGDWVPAGSFALLAAAALGLSLVRARAGSDPAEPAPEVGTPIVSDPAVPSRG
jgi:apolipoprotein N-acyltransferase